MGDKITRILTKITSTFSVNLYNFSYGMFVCVFQVYPVF